MRKNNKKHTPTLATLMLLMLLASFAPQISAQDFEYTYEGQKITYTILDADAKTVSTKAGVVGRPWDDIQQTPGNNVSGALILPEHPQNGDDVYTLTTIADISFYNCSALTSIEIPNSVTSIGRYAFCGCKGLTTLNLPKSVISIDDYAFSSCSNLKSVYIPSSVTSIGWNGFAFCSNLTKAEFESIESLCAIKFGDTTANPLNLSQNLYINGEMITDLVIPEGVTSIGQYALSDCTGISSITFPASIVSIDMNAFGENLQFLKASHQ